MTRPQGKVAKLEIIPEVEVMAMIHLLDRKTRTRMDQGKEADLVMMMVPMMTSTVEEERSPDLEELAVVMKKMALELVGLEDQAMEEMGRSLLLESSVMAVTTTVRENLTQVVMMKMAMEVTLEAREHPSLEKVGMVTKTDVMEWVMTSLAGPIKEETANQVLATMTRIEEAQSMAKMDKEKAHLEVMKETVEMRTEGHLLAVMVVLMMDQDMAKGHLETKTILEDLEENHHKKEKMTKMVAGGQEMLPTSTEETETAKDVEHLAMMMMEIQE